jgi:uncharacterized repeat protein (TIGR04076 family)
MAKTPYAVKITVVDVPGKACPMGHKLGDSWLVDEPRTPKWQGDPAKKNKLCAWAYECFNYVLMPFCYGADYPKAVDKDVHLRTCPGPECQLMFELRRFKQG